MSDDGISFDSNFCPVCGDPREVCEAWGSCRIEVREEIIEYETLHRCERGAIVKLLRKTKGV